MALNTSTPAGVPRLSQATRPFLDYARVEGRFGRQTIEKYDYCLKRVRHFIGDLPVTEITYEHIMSLKSQMLVRRSSVGWQTVILVATKGLLTFSKVQLGLPVLDPDLVTLPKRPHRNVLYLTPDEVERFVRAIPLTTSKHGPHRAGLRFRALVEVLLGSAMRIGEALSLDRSDVDFERKEARVIGKGNNERMVFFTDRALFWLRQYLESRTDDAPALFISRNGVTRLDRGDIWRPFTRYRKVAGLNKPVRPHLLRHTAATQLLFNGCPVSHIKEILGHTRLETTCRYYIGLDQRAAKRAHQRYLVYDTPAAETGESHLAT